MRNMLNIYVYTLRNRWNILSDILKSLYLLHPIKVVVIKSLSHYLLLVSRAANCLQKRSVCMKPNVEEFQLHYSNCKFVFRAKDQDMLTVTRGWILLTWNQSRFISHQTTTPDWTTVYMDQDWIDMDILRSLLTRSMMVNCRCVCNVISFITRDES